MEASLQTRPEDQLSPRLRQILDLAANGQTDKQIAGELGLSLTTVHSHWRRIREHFDASSRTEIIARVLTQKLGDEERDLLLFQLAERDRLMAELAEANERLALQSSTRAVMLQRGMAETERKMAQAQRRIDDLERLNAMTRRTRVLFHEGEYGASWRKHFMSESVDTAIGTAEEWTSGAISIFDVLDPENLPEIMGRYEPFGTARSLEVVPWRLVGGDGRERRMLDFNVMEPCDESGVGQYHGITLDVTEWIAPLREAVERGWPEMERGSDGSDD